MKKIIAFAMSALLAVSAVALPVSAQPAASVAGEIASMDWSQARPVSSEELAQVRANAAETKFPAPEAVVAPKMETDTLSVQGGISSTVIKEALSVAQEAAVNPELQVEMPVLAQITASMAILEHQEGYEYLVSDDNTTIGWQSSNVFDTLCASSEYHVRQRLAGKPETASEPLAIRTKDRTPCSLSPVAPIVDERRMDCIVLVEREGYEYRMNDGQWQSSGGFYSLTADTEYVLYQRIKETADEFASAPTELRVKTCAPLENTSYDNFDRLSKYIQANGFEDDLGTPSIAYSVEVDDNNTYYFVLSGRINTVLCNVFNVSEDPSYIAFDTTFLIPKYSHQLSMYPHSYLLLFHEGEWVEEVEASGPETNAADYTDFCFDTVNGSGAFLTNDSVASMLNSTVALLAGFCDELIYQELGFGLKGLGFISYEGYGELFCSGDIGFHVGTPVTIDYREPGCVINGREGNQHCSACGALLTVGANTPAKGAHQYDNGCDPDCNVCGELRCIQHIYSFACDVECDICGAARTEPLTDHSYGANQLCSKCGYGDLLVGDVSGDGKVNMGDVSRVYAHTTGKTPLTDPKALAAADTNGDGKINLGDTSRILSHVRGTKLLW